MEQQERKILDQKVKMLKKYLEDGKIKIPHDPLLIKSLGQIRVGNDGNIDPSTVNSMVRSMANAVAYIHQEEVARKIPLKEVHRAYIEILEQFFSNPYKEMQKYNLTPKQIASDMATRESVVKAFQSDAQYFEEGIREFWENFAPVVQAHISELTTLKGVYGGDFFPTYNGKIINSVGLYLDTVILPDPMIKALSMHRIMKPDRSLFYLTKHALTALSLKEILLADVNPPIIIISPDRMETDPNYVKFLKTVSEKDTRAHLEKIFDRKFASEVDIDSFLSSLTDESKLISALKDKSRLLYDLEIPNLPLEKQLEKAAELRKQFPSYSLNLEPPGKVLKFEMLGRMMQINDVVQKSRINNGIPLTDAPTSWQYLLWKYEYNKEASDKLNLSYKPMLVANTLTQKQFAWLGNVPNTELVRLRKQGALKNMREVFDKGISEIRSADDKSFSSVVTQVSRNIEESLDKHRKDIRDNSNDIKSLGKDASNWAVEGSISIAASLLNFEPLSLVTTAWSALKGSTGAIAMTKKGMSAAKERRRINNSAMGILFKASNSRD